MALVKNLMGVGVAAAQATQIVGNVADNLTATGTTQLDALPLAAGANVFSTVASGTGARLFTASDIGDTQTVYNQGANSLNVYPPVGGTIQGLSANAALAVVTGSATTFQKTNNTTWQFNTEFLPSGTGGTALPVSTALNRNVITAAYFGATGNGTTDDTTALQNAIDDPRALILIGLTGSNFKTTASLNLNAAIHHGKVIRGSGSFSKTGTGTSKTVITPSSAVSSAFIIDGSVFSTYLQHFVFEDFSVDMVNMTDASTRIAFDMKNAWGWGFRNVRMQNEGTNKRGWKFRNGVYTGKLDNCTARIFEGAGVGADTTTTITFIDCDMQQVIADAMSAWSFFGGTIQGTIDKFVLSNVNGLTIVGLDVEGTGVFLNIGGSNVQGLRVGFNTLGGFSGTNLTGTPIGTNQFLDFDLTFTPTLSGAGTPTYTTQVGSYQRNGRRVSFTIDLVWTGATLDAGFVIAGLPVTSATGPAQAVCVGDAGGVRSSAGANIMANIPSNSTQINVTYYLNPSSMAGATTAINGSIRITGTYQGAP